MSEMMTRSRNKIYKCDICEHKKETRDFKRD